MEKATEAREKNNVAALVDETNLALVNIEMENTLGDLTVSEKIDKLKEKGILNEDLTFASNSDYSLSYNGNIIDANGNKINSLNLSDDIVSIEVDVSSFASAATGKRTIKVINGSLSLENEFDSNDSTKKPYFTFEANPAPEGYKFAYWIDQNNNIIDYYNKHESVDVITDMIFTPIYIKENEIITPKVCVNVYATTQTQENKLQFRTRSSVMNVEGLMSDVKDICGILATNNINFATENYMTVDKNTNTSNSSQLFYNRNNTDVNFASYDFNWTKSNVGTDTFYVRGYRTIKNKKTGETQTYYSNIISVHK